MFEVYFREDAAGIAIYEFDEICDFEYNGVLACELKLLFVLDCVEQEVKAYFVVQNSCTLQVSKLVQPKFVLDFTYNSFLLQLLHDGLVITPPGHQYRHIGVLAL